MRTGIPAEILTALGQRNGIKVRILYWVRAKRRDNGEEEALGIWNGSDVRVFAVEGQSRAYVGGGAFLDFDGLKQETGLVIQRLTMRANPVAPEMVNMLRLYEPKGAPVQVHLAFFDTETDQLLADPYRIFRGWINSVAIKTGAEGEPSTVTVDHVGNARILTRLLPARRSDENQRRRNVADRFFRGAGISGAVQTPWGSKSISNSAPGSSDLWTRSGTNMLRK